MRHSVITAAALAIGLSGCAQSDRPVPTEHSAAVAASHRGAATPAATRHFSAHLSGREEVPTVPSRGQGQARLRLSEDGESLHFSINIANIENVNQSHIHLGRRGENGPVVVWLRPGGPPPVVLPGRFQGPYAEGTVTAANLVGPLAGQPFSVLVDLMVRDSTYINVHTLQFPPGEIRGQVRRQGGPH